jgi:S-adenosylmethionine-diacylgycerolhomoserine-N-methlytransferase
VTTGTDALDHRHAGLMDRMYRYQRHIYDLTRKYYLLGRDSTISGLNVPIGGSLLEVGCGTGRNMLLAARKYPRARLSGLDISAEMLASAEKKLAGCDHRPTLRLADATAFSPTQFGETGFDRIMISYALSMIPDWQKAIDAAIAALAPGGELHIVDFGQQERLPGWFAALLKGWLARFHVTPRKDLRDTLEHRAASNGATLAFKALNGGYAWHAVYRASARSQAGQPDESLVR